MFRAKRFAVAFAAVAALIAASPVRAAWPERPVKMIVTFPPGSANDAAARIFADALSTRWHQPVVVENRAGAEGSIGVSGFVAAHDDHAILYTVAGAVTVTPLLLDKLPYDAATDLVPLASTTSAVLAVAVTGGLQAKNLADLVTLAQQESGKLAWAAGPTLPRYAFAGFLKRHNLAMNFISYRDAAQPQADLGEGRIQVLVTSLLASQSPVQAGRARYLAVLSSNRSDRLPDVPTARELGFPELEVDGLAGVFGSREMAEGVKAKIAADVAEVSKDPELRKRLEVSGQNVLGGSAPQFAAAIARQRTWVSELSHVIDLKNAN